MTKGSTMMYQIPEHEINFDPASGHSHDGINSRAVQSGLAGELHGLTTVNQQADPQNGVTIGPGSVTEAGGGATISLTAQVDCNIAVPGTPALDGPDSAGINRPAGGPGIWLGIYLIKNPTTGDVASVMSENLANPDLSDPAFDGYTIVSPLIGAVLDTGPVAVGILDCTIFGGGDRRKFSFTLPNLAAITIDDSWNTWNVEAPDTTPFFPQLSTKMELDLSLVDPGGAPGGAAIGDGAAPNPFPGGFGKLQAGSSGTMRGAVFSDGLKIAGIDFNPPPGGAQQIWINGFWFP